MAMCGNATTCTGFNASSAEWFKIAEDARQAGNTSWVQQLISRPTSACLRASVLTVDSVEGDNYNVTIPEGLVPGAYLLRNEVSLCSYRSDSRD